MNINVTFHIEVTVFRKNKKFRMLVEHYYSSPQVERFKVNGKDDRYIKLEKRLNIHKQPWKLIEGTIETGDVKQAAMSLMSIQDAIDQYLIKRNREGGTEGHVTPDKK